jgi:glycosyl transferase family 25
MYSTLSEYSYFYNNTKEHFYTETQKPLKVFVIHYKKLSDRKQFILNQFSKHNITDYEFIEIDRDELEKYDISMFESNYSTSQIAISLSHFYAYQQIVEKYDYALILEDDVLLHDDFSSIFSNYMNELPIDYDLLYIGDGCNLHIEKHKLIPNIHIYKKGLEATTWGGNGSSRCTDSYLVNKKCAKNLCTYINQLPYKINSPIDFWINDASRDNQFTVYWAEPTIVTQGTQNGMFSSSH